MLELTGGLGVDHVVEVGGPGTLAKSIQRGEDRRRHQPDRHSDRRAARSTRCRC